MYSYNTFRQLLTKIIVIPMVNIVNTRKLQSNICILYIVCMGTSGHAHTQPNILMKKLGYYISQYFVSSLYRKISAV